jgi:hypothetical protein
LGDKKAAPEGERFVDIAYQERMAGRFKSRPLLQDDSQAALDSLGRRIIRPENTARKKLILNITPASNHRSPTTKGISILTRRSIYGSFPKPV